MSDWRDDQPLEDWEYPDADDSDDSAADTITCPVCQEDVYEEAPQCPRCGQYITADDLRSIRKPMGWIWLAVVVIVIGGFVVGLLR